MIYRFFRKKRVFALLFVLLLLLLFYNSHWMSMWMYPIKYEDSIRASAEAQLVNPFLVAAIARVESNYKPDKVSKKGAVGLMQVMPDTANWIAESRGYDVPLGESLFDPELNIEIGSTFLRMLMEQFGPFAEEDGTSPDDIAVLAAAYNAGPGSVTGWLKNGTWTGKYSDVAMIPFGETRHFVERVIYYYKKYERYYAKDWQAQ